MKKCTHDFTRLRFMDGSDRQGLFGELEYLLQGGSPAADTLLSAKCDDCGVQLGLGPSNDEPVAFEIRAAELGEHNGYLTWETHGAADHVADRDAGPPSQLSERSLAMQDWHAGWLAREIATHDDRESRDADAWPWDPSRLVRHQYLEWIEAGLMAKTENERRAAVAQKRRNALDSLSRPLYDGDYPNEIAQDGSTRAAGGPPTAADTRAAEESEFGGGDRLTIGDVTIALDPPGDDADLPQLTPAERAELTRILSDVPSDDPLAEHAAANDAQFAALDGEAACVCGHAKDEHGGHVDYPGSSACNECEPDACIAYEVEA